MREIIMGRVGWFERGPQKCENRDTVAIMLLCNISKHICILANISVYCKWMLSLLYGY